MAGKYSLENYDRIRFYRYRAMPSIFGLAEGFFNALVAISLIQQGATLKTVSILWGISLAVMIFGILYLAFVPLEPWEIVGSENSGYRIGKKTKGLLKSLYMIWVGWFSGFGCVMTIGSAVRGYHILGTIFLIVGLTLPVIFLIPEYMYLNHEYRETGTVEQKTEEWRRITSLQIKAFWGSVVFMGISTVVYLLLK